MFIFHGLFQHDSRLHDMNRFSKPHTSDTLLQLLITFQPIPFSFFLLCDFFEGLSRMSRSIVFNGFLDTFSRKSVRKLFLTTVMSIKNGFKLEHVPLTEISLHEMICRTLRVKSIFSNKLCESIKILLQLDGKNID